MVILSLVLGLLTRFAAGLCVALLLLLAANQSGGVASLHAGLDALVPGALILLGAGAYSCDAKLSARRVIDFDSR